MAKSGFGLPGRARAIVQCWLIILIGGVVFGLLSCGPLRLILLFYVGYASLMRQSSIRKSASCVSEVVG